MCSIVTRDVNHIVGWVDDPNGRGTWGLITSCFLTLGLCVWSALHLNIPGKHESRRQSWIRQLRWVALGFLIPELVVLAAWKQWSSARALTREMQGILFDQARDEGQSSGQHRQGMRPWTKVHSFYAGMGGFVFELPTPHTNDAEFIPGLSRLTLTTRGVLLLARCGLLPVISKEDIKDKSKSDSLAKSLVLLQAGWMLVQTLTRVVEHLPVSLLEIVTIAHVLSAFFIYMLWWNKPREVREPTTVRCESADQICAYMYMCSRMSGEARKQRRFGIKPKASPEFTWLVYSEPQGDGDEERNSSDTHGPSDEHDSMTATKQANGIAVEKGSQRGPEFGELRIGCRTQRASGPSEPLESDLDVESAEMALVRSRRHMLACRAISTFPAIKARLVEFESLSGPTFEPILEQLVMEGVANWPSDYLLGEVEGEKMGMTLWLASMAYGGIHIAAWNEPFPTQLERFLWHLSSVFISCSGMFWFAANMVGWIWPWAALWWDRYVMLKLERWQYVWTGFGALCCGLMYIFSRVYVVTEAVISLRAAPEGIYETVDWTIFIPHL